MCSDVVMIVSIPLTAVIKNVNMFSVCLVLPITLSGVNHRQSVLSFNTQLQLSSLEIPLKSIHTANVEPHILLQKQHCCSGKQHIVLHQRVILYI